MGSAWIGDDEPPPPRGFWDDDEDEYEDAYGTPAWVVVLFLALLVGLPLLVLWLA